MGHNLEQVRVSMLQVFIQRSSVTTGLPSAYNIRGIQTIVRQALQQAKSIEQTQR